MNTILSVVKEINGLSLNLEGNPSIVILKAEVDDQVAYHIERFETAKSKVISYPSDLFKIGLIKSTVLALHKDSGTAEGSDRVCKECAANGVYSCEHVSPGDWVLGKEKMKSVVGSHIEELSCKGCGAKTKVVKGLCEKCKSQKPSKQMDELGYGSAELSQG